jgi:hypothetical protein
VHSVLAKAYLVAGENKSVGDHNVLTTTSGEDNHLSNIVTGQWLNSPESY